MTERLLQSLIILVLNPVYSITRHIEERVRDIIIQMLWLVLCAYFILARSNYYKESFMGELFPTRSQRYMFCTVLLIVIGIFSINRPLKRVPWRKIIIIPQIILSIGTIIISFIHPVGDGYRMFGFQMLLIFPALYLIWNNRRDYEHIFRQIVYAITFSGIVLFFITYFVSFSGQLIVEPNGRIIGVMGNSNCFSLVGLEMVLGGLFLLTVEKQTIRSVFYSYMSIGMGLGIIMLGQMRIAVLSVIICIPVAIIFNLRHFKSSITKKTFAYILAGALIIIGTVGLSKMIKSNNFNAANKNVESTEVEVVTEENDDKNDVIDRIKIEKGEDINSYSSGRIAIWNSYFSRLNLLGNNYDEYNPSEMAVPKIAPYAHNYFLEISYRCGVPMGIVMTLYILFCGIVCLRYLFFDKGSAEKYKLFPILSMIVFTLEAVLDCALLPFFQLESLLFYLSVMVIIDNRV